MKVNRLEQILNKLNLYQLIKEHTRITPKSKTLIDVIITKEEEVRGERTEETNASTLVRVTSRVTISPKIQCEQTQM